MANTKLYNLSNSVFLERVEELGIRPKFANAINSHVYWKNFDSGDDKVSYISQANFYEQVFKSLDM